MSITLNTASSLVYLKEVKVLGAALSKPEVMIEAYRKAVPWDYVGYMRHYFPLDEYEKYVFNDYAIGHIAMLYNVSDVATSTDPLDMELRQIPLNTNGLNSGVAWTNEGVQPMLCESYEVYDPALGRCYDTRKSLMFVRGTTHAITLTPALMEQNFTVEFWIKLMNTSTSYQQIMSTDFFAIRYESSGKFNATVFNGTASAYQSVASTASATGVWTHVGVANSELSSKSCLYVSGSEAAKNVTVLINTAFSTCKVSDNDNGFTGFIREIHFWKEYRPSSRVHYEMHNFQWHMNGMNFNLKGYYPLNEARGVTLYDYYYTTTPADVNTFEVFTTSRTSPFWVRTETLPVICKFTQIYDRDLDSCRVTKKVLEFANAGVSLPIVYDGPLRDWTFKAWVRYKDVTTVGLTVVEIPKLFKIRTLGLGALEVTAPLDDGTGPFTSTISTVDTVTWYHLSVSHSYARDMLFVEQVPVLLSLPLALQTPPVGTTGSSTYYSGGTMTIFLNYGRFMHVSLWKKYMQTTRYNSTAPSTATTDLIDP